MKNTIFTGAGVAIKLNVEAPDLVTIKSVFFIILVIFSMYGTTFTLFGNFTFSKVSISILNSSYSE